MVNDRWGTDANCKHGDVKLCKDRYSPSKPICLDLIPGDDPRGLASRESTHGFSALGCACRGLNFSKERAGHDHSINALVSQQECWYN